MVSVKGKYSRCASGDQSVPHRRVDCERTAEPIFAHGSVGMIAGERLWRVSALDGLRGDDSGAWVVWTDRVERILVRESAGTVPLGGLWRENLLPGFRLDDFVEKVGRTG